MPRLTGAELEAFLDERGHLARIGTVDDSPDPFEQTAEADTSRLILGLLEELSPEHRAVIQLTYYDGLSIKEIAEITDCPEATVKTRMFYARKRLKTLLTEAGVTGAQV